MATYKVFAMIVLFSKQSFAQYNYLCDFNTKFTTNSNLFRNTSACEASYLNSCGSCRGMAWLWDIETHTLSWGDYIIETTINLGYVAGVGGGAGIRFRATCGGYYYTSIKSFRWDPDGVFNSKFSASDGSTELNDAYKEIGVYIDYILRVEVSGNSWTVFVDGEQMTSVTDSEFSVGSIGLVSDNAVATFKTLYITRTDTTAAPTVQPSTGQPTNRFVFMFYPSEQFIICVRCIHI